MPPRWSPPKPPCATAPSSQRTVREVKAGRQQLERGLARLGIRYFPSGGNFVLAYFGDRAKKIVATLDRKGILLRDRSSDFGGEGYVRITAGTPAQTRPSSANSRPSYDQPALVCTQSF